MSVVRSSQLALLPFAASTTRVIVKVKLAQQTLFGARSATGCAKEEEEERERERET